MGSFLRQGRWGDLGEKECMLITYYLLLITYYLLLNQEWEEWERGELVVDRRN